MFGPKGQACVGQWRTNTPYPGSTADSNADRSTDTVPRLLTAVPAATAMSIRYYYLRSGLQRRDPFFGDPQQIYTRSAAKADPFPANVLLEAERRYGARLVQNGVEKLSIFCGWHRSRKNPRYHYTLRGYNAAGWMSFTVEMEA
ncbi:hypothetical protein EDD18DRAFT_1116956, partial [Armillaria luteobubalina]